MRFAVCAGLLLVGVAGLSPLAWAFEPAASHRVGDEIGAACADAIANAGNELLAAREASNIAMPDAIALLEKRVQVPCGVDILHPGPPPIEAPQDRILPIPTLPVPTSVPYPYQIPDVGSLLPSAPTAPPIPTQGIENAGEKANETMTPIASIGTPDAICPGGDGLGTVTVKVETLDYEFPATGEWSDPGGVTNIHADGVAVSLTMVGTTGTIGIVGVQLPATGTSGTRCETVDSDSCIPFSFLWWHWCWTVHTTTTLPCDGDGMGLLLGLGLIEVDGHLQAAVDPCLSGSFGLAKTNLPTFQDPDFATSLLEVAPGEREGEMLP